MQSDHPWQCSTRFWLPGVKIINISTLINVQKASAFEKKSFSCCTSLWNNQHCKMFYQTYQEFVVLGDQILDLLSHALKAKNERTFKNQNKKRERRYRNVLYNIHEPVLSFTPVRTRNQSYNIHKITIAPKLKWISSWTILTFLCNYVKSELATYEHEINWRVWKKPQPFEGIHDKKYTIIDKKVHS